MKLMEELERYCPWNEQERCDRELFLQFLKHNPDAFERTNTVAHMTASAWVTNAAHTKVLLAYHNIYDSWTWTGGHADGEQDLLAVALRECMEETGVKSVRAVDGRIFSIESLTVDGHEKRGAYVSSHLHLNVTYLLEALEQEELVMNPEENSGVGWFSLDEVCRVSSEPWFNERIFSKLNAKLAEFSKVGA